MGTRSKKWGTDSIISKPFPLSSQREAVFRVYTRADRGPGEPSSFAARLKYTPNRGRQAGVSSYTTKALSGDSAKLRGRRSPGSEVTISTPRPKMEALRAFSTSTAGAFMRRYASSTRFRASESSSRAR